jgi:hypothetical protein
MTGGQLGAVALIAVGEATAILVEFLAYRSGGRPDRTPGWVQVSLLWAVSGMLLVGGYAAGVQAFSGVWAVAAASVAAVLVVEPLVVAAVTRTWPGRRDSACFLLGLAGLIATAVG